MKAHIINLGIRFSLPYSNRVSIHRRIISVNPGMCASLIKKYAESDTTGLSSPSKPTWLAMPTYHRDQRSRRQCPECADVMYYNDVYELPWILRCPVHGCEFTATCPSCKNPWPNVQSIYNSTCEHCGIKSFDSLVELARRVDRQLIFNKLSPIQILAEKCESSEFGVDSATEVNSDFKKIWCKDVPLSSQYYPSFAILAHPQLKESELEALHVKFFPINVTTLRFRTGGELNRSHVCTEDRAKNTNAYTGSHLLSDARLRNQLVLEHSILKKILKWIDNHAPAGHQPLISFTIKKSLLYPGCTYCLALSYWLKLLAYRRIPIKDSYPNFSDDYFPPQLLHSIVNACDLTLGSAELHSKSKDALYQRALEVMFTTLHKALARLKSKSNNSPSDQSMLGKFDNAQLEVPEQYYRVYSSGNTKKVGFIYDSPLQHYLCATGHEYDENTDSVTCSPHGNGYFPKIHGSIDSSLIVSQNIDASTFCCVLNTIIRGVNISTRHGYGVNDWMAIHDALKHFHFSFTEPHR